MYIYRIVKITPKFRDEICDIDFIGREYRPFYSYVNSGKIYLTKSLKHAILNATRQAISEGLASRVKT